MRAGQYRARLWRSTHPPLSSITLDAQGITLNSEEAITLKIGGETSMRARTHLLAQDALRRGLCAVVFQARDPWEVLRRCRKHSLGVILNHRGGTDSTAGHCTVLVGLDEGHAILHDPQLGPARPVARQELLKLWQARPGQRDVAGDVLVVLAPARAPCDPCRECGAVLQDAVVCPGCQAPIPLHPAVVLGCADGRCRARTWEVIFCPACDSPVSSLSGEPARAAPGAAPEDGAELFDKAF